MIRYRFLILPALLFWAVLWAPSEAQVVRGPQVNFNQDDLYVSFVLELDSADIKEIEHGIEKEMNIYADLFKVWPMWPDEFVLGKMLNRTLKVNPIKKEFVATSSDGTVLIHKRFRTFESMLRWTLAVEDLRLANIRELENGKYYVKVTVESKVRKFPPVIGYLFIFISENEFKIMKKSPLFTIDKGR